MNLLKRNTESFKLILDTNVLFSAIILEYVYDELKEVFERNEIDLTLAKDFLATYTTITIVEREFSNGFIELAKKVADRNDRPIFIYTLILRKEKPSTYLVTGDKALRDALNEVSEDMASIEFDPEVNAMFIRFKKGKVSKSEPLADNVIVDLDENGEVVEIEILLPKLEEEQRKFVEILRKLRHEKW